MIPYMEQQHLQLFIYPNIRGARAAITTNLGPHTFAKKHKLCYNYSIEKGMVMKMQTNRTKKILYILRCAWCI